MTHRRYRRDVAHPLPAVGSVSVGVTATPEALWPLVSDPSVPARFSTELEEAAFLEGSGAEVGAVIEGRNVNGGFEWTTHSTVVVCDPPRCFAWATGGAEAPAATWTFLVEDAVGGATLTHSVVLHEGQQPLASAIEAEPDRAAAIVQDRLAVLLVSMERTVSGIAGLAESAEAADG